MVIPSSEVPRGVVDIGNMQLGESSRKESSRMNQAEKALEYFMDLAEGSALRN